MVKSPTANAGDIRDMGSIPVLGRIPGEGNGNPLQYSYLENPMDKGAWQAIVHGVTKNQTQLRRLSTAQKDVFIIVVINKYSYFWRTWCQADC